MPKTTKHTDALTRAGLVPYVTRWSNEHPTRTQLVVRNGSSVGYPQERRGDRDAHGVLWTRYTRDPDAGEPEFGSVHPLRQRNAMRRLLCQGCGGPADRNDQGILWLLGEAADRPWPGQESTGQPPVCLRCAKIASRICPHLRGDFLALRVREAPVAGVRGILHAPTRDGLIRVGMATLHYGDPSVRTLQAHQLLRDLLDCTVVDLNEELTSCH